MNPKLPPLYDPYLTPIGQAPRPELSVLAVCAVMFALVLGPLGALCAIALGLAARRQVVSNPTRYRGHTLATVGTALGIVLTLAWGAAAGAGVWLWNVRRSALVEASIAPPPASEPSSNGNGNGNSNGAPDPRFVAPKVGAPTASSPVDPQSGGAVPRETINRREGGVTIVDIGVSVSSLAEELAKQHKEAKALGQTVLVMTTRDPCDPCRGVNKSLVDPLLQAALDHVRLIRVDIDVFRDDLDQLRMQRQRYPGFFLLAPDLSPKDGIDGGEWDEDIPVNIAPVLGPFVRGKYMKRRQSFRPLPGSGVTL